VNYIFAGFVIKSLDVNYIFAGFFLKSLQMSFRIGLLLGLLVALSVILWFMPKEGFQALDTSNITSAAANQVEYKPRVYPARNTVSGGPSTPNQAPPDNEIRMATPETAHDPYEASEESAAIPERLRHPERMFQPAPSNQTHDIAAASGVASAVQAANALNSFTPEFAQNGGEFMQGIFANDSAEPGGYSPF
jgi:hypothetical protein